MSTKNPTYLKNEDGFCYTYTDHLAAMPDMTPWDGEVDERGIAVTDAPKKPASGKGKNKQAEAPVVVEDSEPEQPAADQKPADE